MYLIPIPCFAERFQTPTTSEKRNCRGNFRQVGHAISGCRHGSIINRRAGKINLITFVEAGPARKLMAEVRQLRHIAPNLVPLHSAFASPAFSYKFTWPMRRTPRTVGYDQLTCSAMFSICTQSTRHGGELTYKDVGTCSPPCVIVFVLDTKSSP